MCCVEMQSECMMEIGNLVHIAETLENIVSRCFGPCASQVLFVRATGDILITRDGCRILESLLLEHPAARLMVRSVSAHCRVTGDGAKSFILLLAAMLRGVRLETGGMGLGCVGARRRRVAVGLARLEQEVLERVLVRHLAPHCASALCLSGGQLRLPGQQATRVLGAYFAGKVGATHAPFLTRLACDFLRRLGDGEMETALGLVADCFPGLQGTVPGLPVGSSSVLEGLPLVGRGFAVRCCHQGKTRVLVAARSLLPPLTRAGCTLRLESPVGLAEARGWAHARVEEALARLRDLGVGLLLSGPRQPACVLELALRHGVSVVDCLADEELALVRRLTGAEPLSRLAEARPADTVPASFARPAPLGHRSWVLVGFAARRGFRPHCLALCAPALGLAEQHRDAIHGAFKLLKLLLPDPRGTGSDWHGETQHCPTRGLQASDTGQGDYESLALGGNEHSTRDLITESERPEPGHLGTENQRHGTGDLGTDSERRGPGHLVTESERHGTGDLGTESERPGPGHLVTESERHGTGDLGTESERPGPGDLGTESERDGTGDLGTKSERHGTGDLGTESESHRTGDLGTESERHMTGDLGTENQRHGTGDLGTESERHGTGELGTESESHRTGDLGTESERDRTGDLGTESQRHRTEGLGTESQRHRTEDLGTESERYGTGDLGTETESHRTGDLATKSESHRTGDLATKCESHRTGDLATKSESHRTGDLGTESERRGTGDLATESERHGTGDLASESESHRTGDLGTKSERRGTGDLGTESESHRTGDLGTKSERHGTGDLVTETDSHRTGELGRADDQTADEMSTDGKGTQHYESEGVGRCGLADQSVPRMWWEPSDCELPAGSVLPPGGAFEFLMHHYLRREAGNQHRPDTTAACRIVADALLTIPRHVHSRASRGRDFLLAHADFAASFREQGAPPPAIEGPLEVVAAKRYLLISVIRCLRSLLTVDRVIRVRGKLVNKPQVESEDSE